MKKTVPLLLCLLMALSLSACGKQAVPAASTDTDAENDTPTANAAVANPWVDFDSPDEAIAAAGFNIAVPEEIEGFDKPIYRVMNNELLEVLYPCADGDLRIRKAAGEEDISGDYNTYEETQTVPPPVRTV